MTAHTLRWSYTEAKKHANSIYRMRLARYRETAKAAGLDPQYMPHAHNAMVSYKQGKPWRNVDYSLVRKCLWLQSHLWDAQRILDRYCRKRDQEDRFWIRANQGKFA